LEGWPLDMGLFHLADIVHPVLLMVAAVSIAAGLYLAVERAFCAMELPPAQTPA